MKSIFHNIQCTLYHAMSKRIFLASWIQQAPPVQQIYQTVRRILG